MIPGCLWPEPELENSSLTIRILGFFSCLFRERANYFQINFHYSFFLMTLTFLKGTKQIIHYEIFDLKQNITFTLCGHLVKQHIEMKTETSNCFEKMFQLLEKSQDLESGFLGKNILKNG